MQILVAIHASGYRLEPSKLYGLAAFGSPLLTATESTLEELGVQRGAYSLSEC